jgi:hypothetical protein
MKPSDKPAKFKASTPPALAIDWNPKVIKKYFVSDDFAVVCVAIL